MVFSSLAAKRYSVRSYKSQPVENEKLHEILEITNLAPTAANRQPFRLIVITTKGKETDLERIYNAPWFVQPPLVICICSIPSEGWVRRDGKAYCDVDTAIAMDHLTLIATDLGLGTCWIGAFDPTAARDILNLPEGVEPIAFTPLGYPDDQPREKKRKPINELVRYEHW
ncbi:nitroreductase family protein [Chloroflexota bacterium]